MSNQLSGIELWEKAKNIEKSLPIKRKAIYDKIKKNYPKIAHKNFVSLNNAFLHGKLPLNIQNEMKNDIQELEDLKQETKFLREESDRLIKEKNAKDTRRYLDPKTEPIPADTYPKLTNCTIYPLRKSCNHGENELFKWVRCEFMKYDNSKSIFDSSRWTCVYEKIEK